MSRLVFFRFFFSLILSFMMISPMWATSAQPASCTYSVTNGWTQTISYQCSSSINLNGAVIQFTVNNPSGILDLNNVWGFINLARYPLNPHLTVSGNTVTLALNFAINPVTLAAGVTTNFSYPTGNNVVVTGFALYPANTAPTSGTLTFAQSQSSAPLPSNTTITVTGVTNSFSATVVFANQTSLSNVPFGTYQLSVAGSVNGQPSTILLSPNQVTLSATNPTAAVSLTYSPPASSLTLSLPVTQPADVSNATVEVNVMDSTKVNHPINVPWGGQATLSNLTAGVTYSLSANPINGQNNYYQFTFSPSSFVAQAGQNSSTISVTVNRLPTGRVNGWPSYLAMGGVTDDSATTTTSFQSRPVDAIFKYGGFGGNGDQGQINYPIFDLETAVQAQTLTTYYQQNNINISVKPVMVIYTAFMSDGATMGDFEYTNLVMHYITLMMEAQKLQSYQTAANPYPGTIILNPDFLGLVQQQNLTPSINSAISQLSLTTALKTAVCFITSTISTEYGANLNYEQLYEAIRASTTDNWTAMSIWDGYKMQYFDSCTANPVVPPTVTLPSITNDFPGWVQAHNWAIRHFAPNITFGWQENLWATGTSNWVHQNYTPAALQTQISNPTAAAIMASTAYSGSYIPDFIVFDKYEMDAIPDACGSGYLFNARDWYNVLAHVKNVSTSLGNIPVMLWQIPGGHLQQTNDIDTRIDHASTEPDFFFGDSATPLNDLMSYITSTQLPASIYGTSNIASYLSMDALGNLNNYSWTTNNLQQTASSNVFAILWGGGNTTSVSSFPSDDNGWLANKIKAYYTNPIPIH